MYKKIISYFLIFAFLFCNASYAENLQLRVPIGDYLRIEETLRSEQAPQAPEEQRFKEAMGAGFSDIRNFYIDERTGRYAFQKELKSKKDAWVTYYYENSLPVELDGSVDDLLALYDEASKEDENDIETRYLIFKRLARYRESASNVKPNLEWLLKKEASKKVLDEIQVAINMVSGNTIDGGKRLKTAYVFYELSPFVARGGVKDVAKELPRTFHNKRGHEASVFIPYWDGIVDDAVKKNNGGVKIEEVEGGSFEIEGEKVQIYAIVMLNRLTGKFEPIDGVPIYLIKCARYFSNIDKGDIYRQELDRTSHLTHPENIMTAIFFSKAVLEAMKVMKLKPDIISTADWQTAHVATLLKKSKNPEAYRFFENTKTLHTIHNIGPKGLIMASPYADNGSDAKKMWDFIDITDDAYQPPDQNGVEFHGMASLQKGGIVYADKVSTVSTNYASELKTQAFGSGFEGINAAANVIGIPNGIALREWNSATSPAISHRFANNPSEKDRRLGVLDTREGKRENKKSMTAMINEVRRQKTDLPRFTCDEDTPVFCFLGRFDDQKGLKILLDILEYDQKIKGLLSGSRIKIVFAGTGNIHYMAKVKELEKTYPDSVAYLGWVDETTAKRLFAGADINIMPSLFEPKGIVQMQAARFGVVNLVNQVGGLKDDIIDFSEGENGNGYTIDFAQGDPFILLRDAMFRAIDDFDGKDKVGWDTKVRKVLADSEKYGWDLSCLKYELLFNSLVGNSSDLLIKHRVDHADLASKPFGQIFEELGIDLSTIKTAADLINIGREVSNAVVKNQGLGKPLNILLTGPTGSLKTTLAETLKEILSEYGLSVEIVQTDFIGREENHFSGLNKKYGDKDVIIAESVIYFPQDANKADLFIRLTGSLHTRQDRITQGSGSYEYAKIRTEAEAVDFKERKEDASMDTDFINISHIESGSFRYFLEKGVSIALKRNILPQSSRNTEQSLLRVPLGTDKYRAEEAIKLLSDSKIKKELSEGVRILKGYNDILSNKGVRLLRDIEDCLHNFNLKKAKALAKRIPTLENMGESFDLFVAIKLPDTLYTDRDRSVCIQFNEGCYNQCLICQPDSGKQYKYMPYPIALKLLNAVYERNSKRGSRKMIFITNILPYDANDPMHYRDKVIGADFSDIYREIIKRFEVLAMITNGWDTKDRVAQRGAEKLASILKKEGTVKLSFHFFYEPLVTALKNNDQKEADRIYRRLKDKFKNVLTVFNGNIKIIPRNLDFYTSQLPGFPDVLTKCYDLQKKAMAEIEEELKNKGIEVAYVEIKDDNLVMWNYGRPRDVLDKMGFNEKTPGMEGSIYSSPGARLEHVFRPDGRLETVTDFSFRVGEYVESPTDKDFLSLLLYMKAVLSRDIPESEESFSDPEKIRKLRYFETRINASPAFNSFLEIVMPARYPVLCRLIVSLDMINLERSKVEKVYRLMKDIEIPYIGLAIGEGFDLSYQILQKNRKDYIVLSPEITPGSAGSFVGERRPVSLNPLRHPESNFRKAYNVLKDLSVTYYKTSRGSL